MDNTIVTRQQEIVERNITVTGKIMQFLLENPDIFDALPDQFELVVLPDPWRPAMRITVGGLAS